MPAYSWEIVPKKPTGTIHFEDKSFLIIHARSAAACGNGSVRIG